MEVVPGGGRGQPLVARETLGPEGRGPWLAGPTAARALRLGPSVEDTFSRHWVTVEDGPAGRPLVLHQGVAAGAAVASDGCDVDDPLGVTGVTGMAPRPRLSRSRTRGLGGRRRRGVRLDRPCGSRSRRAETTLRGLPLLGAERLPKALECLGEPIARLWLLHTRGTPVKRHHDSYQPPSGETPGGGHTGTVAPRPVTCKRAELAARGTRPRASQESARIMGSRGQLQPKRLRACGRRRQPMQSAAKSNPRAASSAEFRIATRH
jgi:hypothetical protein